MELSNNEPCATCGRYKNRRIAVDAIIVQDNNILLIKRAVDPFKDFWALPGGGIDFDQTAVEALCLEVKEEVGLTVISSEFLNIYTDPARDPKQVIALAYIVKTEGKPKAGSDAQECKFFPINTLPQPLAFDHAQIIKDYINTTKQS